MTSRFKKKKHHYDEPFANNLRIVVQVFSAGHQVWIYEKMEEHFFVFHACMRTLGHTVWSLNHKMNSDYQASKDAMMNLLQTTWESGSISTPLHTRAALSSSMWRMAGYSVSLHQPEQRACNITISTRVSFTESSLDQQTKYMCKPDGKGS